MPLGLAGSEGMSAPEKRALVLFVMQPWPDFGMGHLRLR